MSEVFYYTGSDGKRNVDYKNTASLSAIEAVSNHLITSLGDDTSFVKTTVKVIGQTGITGAVVTEAIDVYYYNDGRITANDTLVRAASIGVDLAITGGTALVIAGVIAALPLTVTFGMAFGTVSAIGGVAYNFSFDGSVFDWVDKKFDSTDVDYRLVDADGNMLGRGIYPDGHNEQNGKTQNTAVHELLHEMVENRNISLEEGFKIEVHKGAKEPELVNIFKAYDYQIVGKLVEFSQISLEDFLKLEGNDFGAMDPPSALITNGDLIFQDGDKPWLIGSGDIKLGVLLPNEIGQKGFLVQNIGIAGVTDLNTVDNKESVLWIGGSGSKKYGVIRPSTEGDTYIFGGASDWNVLTGAGNDYIDLTKFEKKPKPLGGPGTSTSSGEGDDKIFGSDKEDFVKAGASSKSGYDEVFTNAGNDTINANLGNDRIDGGADLDTLTYSGSGEETHLTITLDRAALPGGLFGTRPKQPLPTGTFKVTEVVGNETYIDYVTGVEKIIGSDGSDTLILGKNLSSYRGLDIDLGNSEKGFGDTIQIAPDSEGITFVNGRIASADIDIEGAEILVTGDGNDIIILDGDTSIQPAPLPSTSFMRSMSADAPSAPLANHNNYGGVTQVRTNGGDDIVEARGNGVRVDLGVGADHVELRGLNSIITLGSDDDRDTIVFGNGYINDASAEDRLEIGGYNVLGAVKSATSESAYAGDRFGIRYAFNKVGDLVMEDIAGREIFVNNAISGPGVGYQNETLGIHLVERSIEYVRLFSLKASPGWFTDIFKFWFGDYLKTIMDNDNFNYGGVDPIVLDLDGDGLELTAESPYGATFDTDGDGFREPTGWVDRDDGLLVLDKNLDGQVDSVEELFGGPNQAGFDELAEHDTNGDGVIDINDEIYEDLQIWQDLNGNARVDDGELKSLSDHNIASISVNSESLNNESRAQNPLTARADFTRTDGTTGDAYDVVFKIDNFNSEWMGDKTVAEDVKPLANLKGHGTLLDLHVAMTQTASLKTLVEQTLPTLNMVDIAQLREAAMPILEAWALASPFGLADHDDFNILVKRDIQGVTVTDFVMEVTDELGSYWKLGSGDKLYDGLNEITRPTFEQVMAHTPDGAAWEVFSGRKIAVLERYFGENLPLSEAVAGASGAVDAFNNMFSFFLDNLDLLTVKLAIQGPLAGYFEGIAYDDVEDEFVLTTDRQLAPTFEAIFEAAPADSAGAHTWLQAWQPIVFTVLQQLDRGAEHLLMTQSYVFQHLVAAYENKNLNLDIKVAAATFGVEKDLIFTGAGELTGTDEGDFFYMDGSDQIVRGGQGADAYVFGRDFGNDVIDDVEGQLSEKQPDSIRFAHYNADEFVAAREGYELLLTHVPTGSTVRVLRQFEGIIPNLGGGDISEDTGIHEIIFADGTVWDKIDIAKAVSHPLDTDDVLEGTPDIDFLNGGAGNDHMAGGDAGDLYYFGKGYGQDTIREELQWVFNPSVDFIKFDANTTFEDVYFEGVEGTDDLVIRYYDTDDTLTVQGQFAAAYTGVFGTQYNNNIDLITFANGYSYDWHEIIEDIVANHKTDGDDRVFGYDYEDTLDGGAGNDFLTGGNENDTYIFGMGYGHDTIKENLDQINSGMTDTLVFKADVDPATVQYHRDGNSNDLVITLSDGSTMTIQGQFRSANTGVFGVLWFDRIEHFKFEADPAADFTATDLILRLLAEAKTDGDDVIYGFDVADVMDGGLGNDRLEGGYG